MFWLSLFLGCWQKEEASGVVMEFCASNSMICIYALDITLTCMHDKPKFYEEEFNYLDYKLQRISSGMCGVFKIILK